MNDRKEGGLPFRSRAQIAGARPAAMASVLSGYLNVHRGT
jgi:hypothetical protein